MRAVLFIFISLIVIRCARQTQPQGGPKDPDPPQLLISSPKDGEKNFHGTQIQLTFDEGVKLKDPKDEILITPSMGINTKFTVKRNRVVITPQFKLKDSTTYNITFRDGVQDIHESNPADDLHLAFSTGPTIDSLNLYGFVTEAFNGKGTNKITVALYQSDTFDIFQNRATLFTKTNKAGRFLLPNLKPGAYFAYAFEDVNKNQRVDSKAERFGFLSQPIFLPANKDSLRITLIRVDARPIAITSVRNTSNISIVRFNKALDSVKLTASQPIIYTFGDNQSEIVVYKDFNKQDSLRINIFVTDSVQHKLDTAVYVKYTDANLPSQKFKLSEWQTSFDAATNYFTAERHSNKLLLGTTLDSIYIQIDTTTFQQIKANEITFDTLRKKIKLQTTPQINAKEGALNPVLLFGKGAFISFDRDSSRAEDLKITIPKQDQTGTISVELTTSVPNFEVQLTDAKNIIIQRFRNKKSYIFSHVPPNDYYIRVISDTNNNHRWDPGSFSNKNEPENVILYKNPEKKIMFPVRANWELGPLVITF